MAFINRSDARLHEHKVHTINGELLYHRDASGFVYVGSAGQKADAEKKRTLGSYLLWGARGKPNNVGQDIIRNGVRWGLGKRR